MSSWWSVFGNSDWFNWCGLSKNHTTPSETFGPPATALVPNEKHLNCVKNQTFSHGWIQWLLSISCQRGRKKTHIILYSYYATANPKSWGSHFVEHIMCVPATSSSYVEHIHHDSEMNEPRSPPVERWTGSLEKRYGGMSPWMSSRCTNKGRSYQPAQFWVVLL